MQALPRHSRQVRWFGTQALDPPQVENSQPKQLTLAYGDAWSQSHNPGPSASSCQPYSSGKTLPRKKNRQQQVRLQAAIAAAAQPALPGSCIDDQQVRLPQQLPHVRKLR